MKWKTDYTNLICIGITSNKYNKRCNCGIAQLDEFAKQFHVYPWKCLSISMCIPRRNRAACWEQQLPVFLPLKTQCRYKREGVLQISPPIKWVVIKRELMSRRAYCSSECMKVDKSIVFSYSVTDNMAGVAVRLAYLIGRVLNVWRLMLCYLRSQARREG